MKLAQITDCHLFADVTRTGYDDVNPFESLSRVLADCALNRPDRLLLTGDLSQDHSAESYQHLHRLLSEHELLHITHIIPGNHDDIKMLEATFPENCIYDGHSVDLGPWQLHGINTQYQGTKGMVKEDELAALAKVIKDGLGKHHMLAMHHHPLPIDGWMDTHELINRDVFSSWLADLENVRLVVHGHVHMAKTYTLEGVEVLSCPSSCWQWKDSPEFSTDNLAAGYRLIELHASGEMSSQVIRVN